MLAKSFSEDRAQKLCVRGKPDTDSARPCSLSGEMFSEPTLKA